jgi:hypothetical protein
VYDEGNDQGDEMTRFEVPPTIEKAATESNTLGALSISNEFKRSAIVRAYVRPGKPWPKGDRTKSDTISMREFSRLGIVGLSSITTVRRYYEAWDLTGLPDPEPGRPTDLPDPSVLAFPRTIPRKEVTGSGQEPGERDDSDDDTDTDDHDEDESPETNKPEGKTSQEEMEDAWAFAVSFTQEAVKFKSGPRDKGTRTKMIRVYRQALEILEGEQ